MKRRIRSPMQRNIRSFFSRQHFRLKEKEEGFPKGGNLGSPLWLRAKGTPAQTIELIKATPHRDCASDFEHNFCHIDKIDAGILTYFKKILVQDYEKSSGRCGAKP